MLSMYSTAWRIAPIRVCAIAIFFFGFTGAATMPFQSVIAIQEFGLSDAVYSAVTFLAALVNVAASVLIGILSDRLGEYRKALIILSLFGIAGYGLVYLLANDAAFLLAVLALLPVFGALNALIFANVKAFSVGLPPRDRSSINSAVRAMISLSWVLVPGLVGALLASADSMLPAYLIATLAAMVCLGLFLFSLPTVPIVTGQIRPDVKFGASLKRIASPGIFIRILAIALITSTLHVNAAVLPLVTTEVAHGALADVGIMVGIVAVLEIVFILFWARVEPRFGPVLTISIGSLLYVAYLVLLGQCTQVWQLYALTLLSGFGAAAIISLPITYLQELIPDLAGLGSSLISVNLFLSAGLGSLLFGLGTWVSGYGGTAVLAGLAGAVGVALVYGLDRKKTVPAT